MMAPARRRGAWGRLASHPRWAPPWVSIRTCSTSSRIRSRTSSAGFSPKSKPGFGWAARGCAARAPRSSRTSARSSTQRAINTHHQIRLAVPLRRLTPHVSAAVENVRDRYNYEIDTRARYRSELLTAGTDIQLTGEASLGVNLRRWRLRFDVGDQFLNTSLREVFDRDLETVSIVFRHRLTPLTSFVVVADRERERFEFSPFRNADGVRFMPGVEFKPALLSGAAYVGYRKLTPLTRTIPEYSGIAASVDLAYTLRGVTRLAVRASRDVTYSVELVQPVLSPDRAGARHHASTGR